MLYLIDVKIEKKSSFMAHNLHNFWIMKGCITYSVIISIICLTFFCGTGGDVIAAETSDLSILEARMLEKINSARANPLETAAALGMDVDQVVHDFPDKSDILKNGLPPLSVNDALHRSAAVHTSDMIEHDFYNSVSPDGRTSQDRISAEGYAAEAAGEALGIIAFVNFIGQAQAADIMFNSILTRELTHGTGSDWNILNPDFEDIGIGAGSGVMSVNGGVYNAYLVTIDLGKSIPSEKDYSFAEMEQALLNLINQARSNPLDAAASLGLDAEKILADFPEFEGVLRQGMPPMSRNKQLVQAAAGHTQSMLESQVFSHYSQNDLTISDRISESGYEAALTGEIIGRYYVDATGSEMAAVEYIFEKMFLSEFDAESPDFQYILNPDLSEAGVSFGYGFMDLGMGVDLRNAYVVSCAFARPAVIDGYHLTGIVFVDENQDAIYQPAEGADGVNIGLAECDSKGYCYQIDQTVSDGVGGFEFELYPGVFMLSVDFAGESENYWFAAETGNRGVQIRIEPETRETVIFFQ